MSPKQRDRLKVLHEVKQGHLKQACGAEQLGLSERWVRELVRRLRRRGDRAVLHGLAGKVSNRRIDRKLEQQAVRLYESEYSDFGPTLASEYLAEQHGMRVSKETLRKWLIKAGVWKARQRQAKQVHMWRARRSCRGELVQWDISIHDWLESRGEQRLKLIAMIDDATNELFARFVLEDTTVEHLRVLGQYLEQHGRPVAFYTDKAALFHVTPRKIGYYGEQSASGQTQIGRALGELGIELILAHSPQAKGRVERCFGVLQDRLVKGLRKAGVKTLETANQYLEEIFLPLWNRRFGRDPASEVDAHRPLAAGVELGSILCLVETRRVANDYTVSWGGHLYQIPRSAVRPGLRSATIRIEQHLDGTLWARVQELSVLLNRCEPNQVATVNAKTAPKRKNPDRSEPSQWMKNFHLSGPSLPVWKAAKIANRTG